MDNVKLIIQVEYPESKKKLLTLNVLYVNINILNNVVHLAPIV